MLHWSSLSHPNHWHRTHLPRYFWRAAALVLAIMTLGIGLTLSFLSSADSISKVQRTQAQINVADTLQSYIATWRQQDDPLVTLPDGVQAKSSNVNGVEIGGTRYYYQLTHHVSFDPLRLGKLTNYEVVSVVSPNSPDETIIYRAK